MRTLSGFISEAIWKVAFYKNPLLCVSNSIYQPLWCTHVCVCSLSFPPRRKLDEDRTLMSLLILALCLDCFRCLKGGVHKYLSKEGRQEGGLTGPKRPLWSSGGSPCLLLFSPPQPTAPGLAQSLSSHLTLSRPPRLHPAPCHSPTQQCHRVRL